MAKPLPGYLRYPGDYSQSPQFMCSLAAQGLWLLLEDVMHSSERYGYLQFQGKPMSDEMIVRRCGGINLEDFRAAFAELERMGCITREKQSRVVYSENLVAQDMKRAGGRERVHRHRHAADETGAKPEPNSEQSGAKLRDKVGTTTGSKLLDALDECNGDVTSYPHARVGLASVLAFASSNSLPTPEASGQPPTRPEASQDHPEKCLPADAPGVLESGIVTGSTPTLAALAAPIPADVLAAANARAVLAAGELASWAMVDLVVEVALASPAALANRWSPLSVEQDLGITGPIWDAIKLEAAEQGMSEREAALWLLPRVRTITGAVQGQVGWQRYWTKARMARFYKAVEYRVVENYQAQGGGNGATPGGSKASARSTVAERNQAALQRLLGEPNGTQRAPDGAGSGAGESGGHAEPGLVEAGGAGDVHRDARGVHAGAVHSGNGNGSRAMSLLPKSLRAARVRFPG